MLHIVKMIERRDPDRAGTIIRAMFFASGSALLAGLGMLLIP